MSESHWSQSPHSLALGAATVHVWRVGLWSAGADWTANVGMLSPEERERALRFRRPRDGQQFAHTRAALRLLLGRLSHASASALRFAYGAQGKPQLVADGSHAPLWFNVSHSGDYALIAASAEGELGVDIERVRADFSGDAIAERFFCDAEIDWLRGLPDDQRSDGFFQLWTRKEAFLKACGEGIWHDLSRFDVSHAPHAPVRGQGQDSAWFLHDLDPAPGYRAALAVRDNVTAIRIWEWVR